jgi:hypothetical protein
VSSTVGFIPDRLERTFEVPLDVVVQGFEGGDVKDADPWIEVPGEMLLNQMIDGPEECRQRLARAGWREDEGMLPRGNTRPPQNLRRSRFPVCSLKPRTNGWKSVRTG